MTGGNSFFPAPANVWFPWDLGVMLCRPEGPGPEKGEAGEPVTTEASSAPVLMHCSPHTLHAHLSSHTSAPSNTHKPPRCPHRPPSPTAPPDSPGSHTGPVTRTCSPHRLHASHSYPSTLVHVTLPETVHAGVITPPSLCAHPTPAPTHFLSHTSACLPAPWLSTLCKVTPRSPPTGPWLPHTVCTHSFTQIPHRRLPSTSAAIQKPSPHGHFPSLSSSSLGPPGAPPPWPSAYPYCPLPFCARLTCPQSHTHTHQGSQHSHTLVVAAPHTSSTLFAAFPHSLHIRLPITN